MMKGTDRCTPPYIRLSWCTSVGQFRVPALTKPDIGGCTCIKVGGVHASKGGVHLSAPMMESAPRGGG